VPKDPWGNDYQYRAPGQNGPFDIWSLGADGQEGGDGESQDITSWESPDASEPP
jgi:general secretion pathway protein G